ncbi:MAG: SDR family oxidoreductase [Anaerolineae bacterium]
MKRNSRPFRNNVVIITEASTGIGRELALQLAIQGARLALVAQDGERLKEVARECAKRGGSALFVPTDVADEAQSRALVEQTVAEFGRLDMLINNAGMGMWARFEELADLNPFERMMRVNYFGSVYCTQAALPHLRRSRGRLVAVSSLTGKSGTPTRTGYAATEHAMIGFFDSLRMELAGSRVSVTVVYPGFVATEIQECASGPNGRALATGNSSVYAADVMTAQERARQILKASAARRRGLVMTQHGRVEMCLKLVAPGLMNRVALSWIE